MTDLSNPSNWPSLAKPDPEWEEVVKHVPGGAPDIGQFADIPSLRNFIVQVKAQAEQPPVPAGVKEEDRQITVRDGQKITVRIHSPEKASSGGSPLGVIYHGGGWCIGGLDDEQRLIRRMVSDFGFVVVNVDYRMAPEHTFPVCSDDCYDATKWAADNASSLGADPTKGFIIGGTSAGGNLTAVVSHLWLDDKLTPKITGCLLMIPAVLNAAAFPDKYRSELQSWDQLEFAPILSRKACDLFMNNYCPNIEDRKGQLMSPMLWKSGHKDQPPQVFMICGSDPLRDEALVYERILREEYGVKTKIEMYPGLPHGFWGLFPQMKASLKFLEDSVAAVKWLLEQK